MIEYLVEQRHVQEDHHLTVYMGFDRTTALALRQASEDDLVKSFIGERWTTEMFERDVSDWRICNET